MKQQGFSLIELMITVVIVGIVASIAYPSYQNNILQSHRADAKGALLDLANFMERHATEMGCYTDPGGDGQCGTGDDSIPNLPYTTAPKDGTAFYNITALPVTASAFTLTATPRSSTSQVNDPCGSLTLTNTGVKGVIPTDTTFTSADCW